MIREVITRLFTEYPMARQEEYTGHTFALWIREIVPKAFESVASDFPDLIWDASPGLGRWADAPWIAAFDPLVTESAQEGYYPVYLYNRSLDTVYLSLNQGMTRLRDEFGTQAKRILIHRAGILRSRPRSRLQDSIHRHANRSPALGLAEQARLL